MVEEIDWVSGQITLSLPCIRIVLTMFKEGDEEKMFIESHISIEPRAITLVRPGPRRGGSTTKKSFSSSTKAYKKEKEDTFREKKNKDVLDTYHADLKKSLMCGFDSMEEVLKAKKYENTARSVVLPVSTRAIGVSVVNTYNKATSTETNRQRLPAVTIHQLYRVFLAMVERKVFENRLDARLDDRDIWYDPAPFEPFKTVITSNNIRPQQIGALIRCLPNFKYDETNFVMLFPAKQFTAQKFIYLSPRLCI